MLKTIQVIALLQGVFLIIILFKHKKEHKSVNFWLVLSCVFSVLLYSLGDDDFNLIVDNSNWYLFYDPLLITTFFLMVRYHTSSFSKFYLKDLLFFIPYIVFISFQFIGDLFSFEDSGVLLQTVNGIINAVLLAYLVIIIRKVFKKEKWILYFIVPYSILFLIDRLSYQITGSYDTIPFLESYGVIGLSAFLFYIILFKLVISPKTVLPKSEITRYKTSNLNTSNVEDYKKVLIKLMEDEKIFKNSSITVHNVANRIGIPRQHLSEILNVHLKTSFQDFINQYRIEEFVMCLKKPKYNNYTILGIANEVGFKSKSSFNTTFKKVKGVTPSQFKKQLK